ncbi:MAG: efflux RND transporter periplasmic adaptor subunit [Planctomycetota bacterium]|jgi:cobalt-zinc-cadmium efflux system membrane fusion protein
MFRLHKQLVVIVMLTFVICWPGTFVLAAETCDCPDCATPPVEQTDHVHAEEDEHAECDDAHEAEDACTDCDHAAPAEQDAHAACDHAAQTEDDPHAGHAHDELIRLDPAARSLIGFRTVTAQTGSLSSTVRLTGRVELNADKVAHIVPLTAGIVRQADIQIGDPVKKGDILAWIESAELGKAKVQYLDIQAELGCCATLLARAQQIHDNTLKLIEILKANPSLDDLQKIQSLEMGDNRSLLIKAYAEYVLAKSVYDREKPLYEQKISSKQEYLNAENGLKKARAEYNAVLDTIQFKVKQDLLETTSDQQRQEIALKGVERTLYVLGQSQADIQTLDRLAQNPLASADSEHACPDPNCDACKAKAMMTGPMQPTPDAFQRLGWYPLRAPFDGTIIDKHITLGERLNDDAAVFTVADLQSVWIDLAIFPKDLASVRKGQVCQISFENQSFEGEISFVSPVLDPKTRTVTARVVMDNADGNLRPGLFVTGVIYGKSAKGNIIVPRQAVQLIEGNQCVFVDEGAGYELRPVELGRGNVDYVEILSGLRKGEKIITKGAFDLKAKIVTSTMDSHAGHGH